MSLEGDVLDGVLLKDKDSGICGTVEIVCVSLLELRRKSSHFITDVVAVLNYFYIFNK